MKVAEAVSKRLLNICKERNITVNKLATISCLTQSTVDNIVSCKTRNPKLLTIIRICDGLNIELNNFFNDKLFKDIDRED
ncbi:MAG: helix-turn-helix transcriptional regulator [Bacilli bacterium]|nr:helix-turn-helix transcriptional regulator [Bacilli bacterium]